MVKLDELLVRVNSDGIFFYAFFEDLNGVIGITSKSVGIAQALVRTEIIGIELNREKILLLSFATHTKLSVSSPKIHMGICKVGSSFCVLLELKLCTMEISSLQMGETESCSNRVYERFTIQTACDLCSPTVPVKQVRVSIECHFVQSNCFFKSIPVE